MLTHPTNTADTDRARLAEALLQRYGRWTAARRVRARFKAAAWDFTIAAALGLKRTIDIVVSGAALTALAPLFAVVALIIKSDGGPAIFWQTRIGRHGREMAFPKFRSMVADAEAKKAALMAANDLGSSLTFKMKRDPRITPIGRFIRRLSIDEMPQLWLVFTGDLSLVGPRPPVPSEVDRYSIDDRRRLDVTPGLTCIWQVSGRSTIPFEQQVKLDVAYIESRSIWLDLRLLLRTIPAVLTGRGAF
jgi:lipopolysaccharide/colanic/teichoic acid biosynthesis glycosyltransferase